MSVGELIQLDKNNIDQELYKRLRKKIIEERHDISIDELIEYLRIQNLK